MNSILLEVCVDSVESALATQKGGADRIELCSNLLIGGTTPNINLYHAVRKRIELPIHVLIRPRFGDFCYSEYEYEMIKEDIQMFTDAGANGVVCGFLSPDGSLNEQRLEESIGLCRGINFTLHRAFDVCREPLTALKQAQKFGVTAILTSGQKATAFQGKELIRTLVQNSGNVEIMTGSGVNSKNLPELIAATGARSYHMSAKREKDSSMNYRKSDVPMGLPLISEYTIYEADVAEISAARKILDNI